MMMMMGKDFVLTRFHSERTPRRYNDYIIWHRCSTLRDKKRFHVSQFMRIITILCEVLADMDILLGCRP